MSQLKRVTLTLRTVRHLRASQVAHRARLRAQRRLISRAPGPAARLLARPVPALRGWPAVFVPMDAALPWPSAELLAQGRIDLLGLERSLDQWGSDEPPQLWRYHLHYWDWAWSLVVDLDRERARAVYQQLLSRWTEQTRFGQPDVWSPYVVALRAWSWCGQFEALVRGTELEDDVVRLLALHAGFLQAHLELDVGGNHLVKDLKALVGLGVFLGDQAMVSRALRRLRRAVSRQVLADGGHEERAPAYHCQVLADLIDLDGLLGSDSPAWLRDAIDRMRRWLGIVLLPDGTVPLLNDGFPVSAELLTALRPGPAAPDGLTLLQDSGLAVLRRGRAFVLADVGPPCPDDLPAHAHADTLGFLLYAGATPVVSEVGTSTYEPGPVRDWERSTAAHSTVEVDGADSTEVWGAFRAARRARVSVHEAMDDGETVVVTASHDGYRRLPGSPVHRRTWLLTADRLRVEDVVTGAGTHDLAVRLHTTDSALVGSPSSFTEVECQAAGGWHRRATSIFLMKWTRADLPWHSEFDIAVLPESAP